MPRRAGRQAAPIHASAKVEGSRRIGVGWRVQATRHAGYGREGFGGWRRREAALDRQYRRHARAAQHRRAGRRTRTVVSAAAAVAIALPGGIVSHHGHLHGHLARLHDGKAHAQGQTDPEKKRKNPSRRPLLHGHGTWQTCPRPTSRFGSRRRDGAAPGRPLASLPLVVPAISAAPRPGTQRCRRSGGKERAGRPAMAGSRAAARMLRLRRRRH